MERKVGVERLYYLGDYKNIKFTNEVSEIPELLSENDRVMELIHKQAYLACEFAYRQYVEMIEDINEKFTTVENGRKVTDSQAVMEFLQSERTQTLKDLYEEIYNLTNKLLKELPQKETN